MSYLFLNDAENPFKVEEGKAVKKDYSEELKDVVNTRYNKEDSEYVYNLFTDEQSRVLKQIYKNFAIDMYADLCETLNIQIDTQNKANKAAIDAIGKRLGRPIKAEEWQYDGFVQFGKDDKQMCDLCNKRSIQNTHYIVNKITKNTLQFGCQCAGEFLHLTPTTLSSLKSVQANTLSDLKILAYVRETKTEKKYLLLACGNLGEIIVKEGKQGLLDLMPFEVVWVDKQHIEGANDLYTVKYSDTQKCKKSLNWIKEHIGTCINADLDDKYYSNIEDRKLVPLATLKNDKKIINTRVLLKAAMTCLDVGLVVPLHIANKLNRLLSSMAKAHHMDYTAFINELLMSDVLQNSSLIKAAFSDFIVNYLVSRASKNAIPRDEEMSYWGIKGITTFYNTVMKWQAILLEMQVVKRVLNFEKENYISYEEKAISGVIRPASQRILGNDNGISLVEYLNTISQLLLSRRKVEKNESNLKEGYSQYTLKGVDSKLLLLAPQDKTNEIAINTLPWEIGVMYGLFKEGLRRIVVSEINTISRIFVMPAIAAGDDEIFLKYLLSFKPYLQNDRDGVKIVNSFRNNRFYINSLEIEKPENLEGFLKKFSIITDKEVKTYYKEYKSVIPKLRADLKEFGKQLLEIKKGIETSRGFTSSILYNSKGMKEVSADFETIIEKQKGKLWVDYFADYVGLFDKNRGTNKVQEWLIKMPLIYDVSNGALNVLGNFTKFEKYRGMFDALTDTTELEKELKKYTSGLVKYSEIGTKDKDGYTICQKAYICESHNKYDLLDKFDKTIIETVLNTKYEGGILDRYVNMLYTYLVRYNGSFDSKNMDKIANVTAEHSIKELARDMLYDDANAQLLDANAKTELVRISRVFGLTIKESYFVIEQYKKFYNKMPHLAVLKQVNKEIEILKKILDKVITSKKYEKLKDEDKAHLESIKGSGLVTVFEKEWFIGICEEIGIDCGELFVKYEKEWQDVEQSQSIKDYHDLATYTEYLESFPDYIEKTSTVDRAMFRVIKARNEATSSQLKALKNASRVLGAEYNEEKLGIVTKEEVSESKKDGGTPDESDIKAYTSYLMKHKDFSKLDELEQSIIKNVNTRGKITEKQLYRIERACKKIGVPLDKSKVQVAATEMAKDADNLLDIAKQIKDHPDFSKLDSKKQSIIKTIVQYNKVSEKQGYWVNVIKKELNL